jgi:hypothetical protein
MRSTRIAIRTKLGGTTLLMLEETETAMGLAEMREFVQSSDAGIATVLIEVPKPAAVESEAA